MRKRIFVFVAALFLITICISPVFANIMPIISNLNYEWQGSFSEDEKKIIENTLSQLFDGWNFEDEQSLLPLFEGDSKDDSLKKIDEFISIKRPIEIRELWLKKIVVAKEKEMLIVRLELQSNFVTEGSNEFSIFFSFNKKNNALKISSYRIEPEIDSILPPIENYIGKFTWANKPLDTKCIKEVQDIVKSFMIANKHMNIELGLFRLLSADERERMIDDFTLKERVEAEKTSFNAVNDDTIEVKIDQIVKKRNIIGERKVQVNLKLTKDKEGWAISRVKFEPTYSLLATSLESFNWSNKPDDEKTIKTIENLIKQYMIVCIQKEPGKSIFDNVPETERNEVIKEITDYRFQIEEIRVKEVNLGLLSDGIVEASIIQDVKVRNDSAPKNVKVSLRISKSSSEWNINKVQFEPKYSSFAYVEEKNYPNMRITCMLSPQFKEYAAKLIDKTKEAYDFYESILGKTNYTELRIRERTAAEDQVIGLNADFSQGLIRISHDVVADVASENFGISHEVSHAWTTSANRQKEVWLQEGTADYLAWLFMRTKGDEKQALQRRKDIIAQYTDENSTILGKDKPLAELTYQLWPLSSEAGFLVYQKGSFVLYMLEKEIGKKALADAVSKLYTSYDEVNSANFQDAVTKVTGKDYSWFFKQWVYKTGYPKLAFNYQVEKKHDKSILKVNITQKNGLFRLSLPLLIKTNEKEEKCILDLKDKEQKWQFELDGEITELLLDPNNDCLKYVEFNDVEVLSKAKAALAGGKLDETEQLLNSVLMLDIEYYNIVSKLASSYRNKGDIDKALKYYERFFLHANDENCPIYLGMLAMEYKKYDYAKVKFEAFLNGDATKSNPNRIIAVWTLANIFALERKSIKAICMLSEIKDDIPKVPVIALLRAGLYLNLKLTKTASEDCAYLKGVEKDLSDAQRVRLYLLLGKIADLQGQRSNAIESYRIASSLKGDPSDIELAKKGIDISLCNENFYFTDMSQITVQTNFN